MKFYKLKNNEEKIIFTFRAESKKWSEWKLACIMQATTLTRSLDSLKVLNTHAWTILASHSRGPC